MELLLVLHAHLPWVKDPDHPGSIEERWLFEALWECYLPLLGVLDAAAEAGRRELLTLSVSPTLLLMLGDERLREGFVQHVEAVLELADRAGATRAEWAEALSDHARRARASLARFEAIGRDLPAALGEHHRAGTIELCTTAATHPFLPACSSDAHVAAQISVGREVLARATGVDPVGLWLPECGFEPRLDEILARSGVGLTFLDGHGIELGRPRSPLGVAAPILTPSGVAAFGRDAGATERVWSRARGYPGDPAYRERHRDLADVWPAEALGALAPPPGARSPVGLGPFRITGTEEKAVYEPAAAHARAREHAEHFVASAARDLAAAPRLEGAEPSLTAPYDAELFGHWWWEGPTFLEAVLELAPRAGVRLATASGHLGRSPRLVRSAPATSTWGAGGFAEVWAGEGSGARVRAIHRVERRVSRAFAHVARRGPSVSPVALSARDLAARELMLAAASDWSFLVRTGTNVGYATRRAGEHEAAALELAAIAETDDPRAQARVAELARGGPPVASFPRALLEASWTTRG